MVALQTVSGRQVCDAVMNCWAVHETVVVCVVVDVGLVVVVVLVLVRPKGATMPAATETQLLEACVNSEKQGGPIKIISLLI